MEQRVSRYSLPRHTNLASMGKRFWAAIVDLAIFFAGAIALFYGCTNLIFRNAWTNELNEVLNDYDLKSHLTYLDEKGVKLFYESTEDYTVFDNQLRYYYLNYLTGEGIENPEVNAAPTYNSEMTLEDGSKVLPKDYFTVEWYNKTIYELNPNDPFGESKTCYFKYQVDGDNNVLYDQLGIAQDADYDASKKLSNTDRATFMRLKYRSAYNELTKISFYYDVYKLYSFLTLLSGMIPILVSGLIAYVLIPYFMKNNATIGKLFFKTGLANIHGYLYDKRYLLLRFVPFFLIWAVVTFVTNTLFLLTVILFVATFVSSFALMMASPKHTSLHDYTGRSIVIDTTSSIIFNDSIEEEAYIEREDKEEEARILAKQKERKAF